MSGWLALAVTAKGDRSTGLRVVREMYSAFQRIDEELKAELTHRWKRTFLRIHGNLESQRQTQLLALGEHYSLPIVGSVQLFQFIFILESYFTLVLRLLACRAITDKSLSGLSQEEMFSGRCLTDNGVFNYGIDRLFDWPLRLVDSQNLFRPIVEAVDSIDLQEYSRDLVKDLFHNVFPQRLRHSLGEIYTPDWLAQIVVDDLVASDATAAARTYLDPTCGSGTFLIDVLRRHLTDDNVGILDRIFGFDINPVAALAAKTNILLVAGRQLRQRRSPYCLPIFNVDCLQSCFVPRLQSTSSASCDLGPDLLKLGARLLEERPSIQSLLEAVTGMWESNRLSKDDGERLIAQLSPALLRDIDYVVGNPPWVNWEYLPKDYRTETASLWQEYRLFDFSGRDSTFIKEDISSLITYVVADRHLRTGGSLGFVLKQTLFKSSKHGEGFRQFRLNTTHIPLGVRKVEDLSQVRAFSGVNTKAAILILDKGRPTTYPVEYNIWTPRGRASFNEHDSAEGVAGNTVIDRKVAQPVRPSNPFSGWISTDRSGVEGLHSVLGPSSYRARTGIFTGGLNAAFWLDVIEDRGDRLLVRNFAPRAKIKVREQTAEIEKALLFPFVTGRDLSMWKVNYSRYIVCAHTAKTRMEPLDREHLAVQFPRTWKYFEGLRPELEARKGFAGWEKGIHERYFYALQRIGEYTFTPYKVAWRYIASKFTPAVIPPAHDAYLGNRVMLPNEKVIFVGFNEPRPAYFLCGLLSSTIYRTAIESFMVNTQVGPSVIDNLWLPEFDDRSELHSEISDICQRGHQVGFTATRLNEIDRLVSSLRQEIRSTPQVSPKYQLSCL